MLIRIFAITLIIVAVSFLLGIFTKIPLETLYAVPPIIAIYLGLELLIARNRKRKQNA